MNEETIQRHVVARLRIARAVFCHVPNGSKATPRYRAKLKALGVEPGVPDLLIFSAPGGPCALELKTTKGRLSFDQLGWLGRLEELGWRVAVAYGLDDALARLESWGAIGSVSSSATTRSQ
jgi:Fe2+ transport system protein FeoA